MEIGKNEYIAHQNSLELTTETAEVSNRGKTGLSNPRTGIPVFNS